MTPRPVDLSLLAPPSSDHPGAHLLGRLAAGEPDAPELAAAAAHVEACPTCRARLSDLDAERRAFLALHPTPAFLATLETRRASRRSPWARLRWPLAASALALAAAALLVVALLPAAPPETRLKSGYDLSFHVRSGDRVALGQPGARLHPGDAIQLRYSAPRAAHLVVISLDGAGAVTAYYDADGRALPVDPGVAVLLDGSIVLDATLGPERVIGCFSEAPLTTAAVLAAGTRALAAASGDPAAVTRLPLPCPQATFLVDKVAP